jgi:hypothetical protein
MEWSSSIAPAFFAAFEVQNRPFLTETGGALWAKDVLMPAIRNTAVNEVFICAGYHNIDYNEYQ